ncbi:MAG: hypothetical protein FJ252_00700, partial [Phycisphaerae bacterium]|nr:hypothetical protein [Phycisphaerae bacterium]
MNIAITSAGSLLAPSLLVCAVMATPPAGRQDEPEFKSTLTRVREGGTPFDPSQKLEPYAIRRATDGGLANDIGSSPIRSVPEYGPTRGVLYQYGNSWNSVVTALVSSLTAGTVNDEIAY